MTTPVKNDGAGTGATEWSRESAPIPARPQKYDACWDPRADFDALQALLGPGACDGSASTGDDIIGEDSNTLELNSLSDYLAVPTFAAAFNGAANWTDAALKKYTDPIKQASEQHATTSVWNSTKSLPQMEVLKTFINMPADSSGFYIDPANQNAFVSHLGDPTTAQKIQMVEATVSDNRIVRLYHVTPASGDAFSYVQVIDNPQPREDAAVTKISISTATPDTVTTAEAIFQGTHLQGVADMPAADLDQFVYTVEDEDDVVVTTSGYTAERKKDGSGFQMVFEGEKSDDVNLIPDWHPMTRLAEKESPYHVPEVKPADFEDEDLDVYEEPRTANKADDKPAAVIPEEPRLAREPDDPIASYVTNQKKYISGLRDSALLTNGSRDFVEQDAKPTLDLLEQYLENRPEFLDELSDGDAIRWSNDLDGGDGAEFVVVDTESSNEGGYKEERSLVLSPKEKNPKSFFIITETINEERGNSKKPVSSLVSIREISLNQESATVLTDVIMERSQGYQTLIIQGSHEGKSVNLAYIAGDSHQWLLTDTDGSRVLKNDIANQDAPYNLSSAYKLKVPFVSAENWMPTREGCNLFLDGNNSAAQIYADKITDNKKFWRPIEASGGAAVGLTGGWHSYTTPSGDGYQVGGADALLMGRLYLDWNAYGNKEVTWSFLRPEVTLAAGYNLMGNLDPEIKPSAENPGFPAIPAEGSFRLNLAHFGGGADLPKLRDELQSWDVGLFNPYISTGYGFGQPFNGVVSAGTSDQPISAENIFQGLDLGWLLYFRKGIVQVELSGGGSVPFLPNGVVTGEMKNYEGVENGIPVSGKKVRLGLTFEL